MVIEPGECWVFSCRLNQCYFDYSNRIFQLRFLLRMLHTLNHYVLKKWYKKIPPHSLFLHIRYQVRVATLLLFILFLYLSMKPMITYLSMKSMITGVVTSILSIPLYFFAKNSHRQLRGQVLTVSHEKMQFFFSLVLLLCSYYDFWFCDLFSFKISFSWTCR